MVPLYWIRVYVGTAHLFNKDPEFYATILASPDDFKLLDRAILGGKEGVGRIVVYLNPHNHFILLWKYSCRAYSERGGKYRLKGDKLIDWLTCL